MTTAKNSTIIWLNSCSEGLPTQYFITIWIMMDFVLTFIIIVSIPHAKVAAIQNPAWVRSNDPGAH